jgi:hypothetical protein
MKAAIVLLALLGIAAFQACSTFTPDSRDPQTPGIGGHTPVVFVSGVTGTKLRDARTGKLLWGGTRQLFRPRDGGYSLVLPLTVGESADPNASPPHPQSRFDAFEPIWQLRFPAWTKQIYRPLLEHFQAAGFRMGDLRSPGPADDLFFFNYDWRYGNLDSVRRLDSRLSILSEARGGRDVDLVCQSNAAKICRWLTKYGAQGTEEAAAGVAWTRSYRIRKVILAGASNGGALRVLQLLIQGRNYVPLVGRRLLPETFFSIRPLYEDLPADRSDLFFDEQGSILDIDLFDVENWQEYGWSIFGREASRRLRRGSRQDLFGNRQDQVDYLENQLRHARLFQHLLGRDSEHFPTVHYYLIENASSPTIDRALLTREGGEWQTYFLGDRRVDRDRILKDLASAPGDGHAVLASQRGLSSQEVASIAAKQSVSGGHFEAIIQPAALDAILAFLDQPVTSHR